MKSPLWTRRWKRVKIKAEKFLLCRTVKKEFILHWNESVLVYEPFLSDCCFFYLWRFSLALRERSFFISPYLCYPSYLLHLNANRTKMRTIFKGKHFKNGKIERVGGAALPQKFLSRLSFWRICLPKEDFYFYLHISNQSCPKYENIEMWKCPQSIANISQINLIFTISEGRRLQERKAILRSYFSFYFILMFRKRNCIHSPMCFLLFAFPDNSNYV